jgi:hypothetical protein
MIMKNSTRMNLVIITFINWSIALFVNQTYNYISAVILCITLAYLLKNAKEIGPKWEPINFGKLFK